MRRSYALVAIALAALAASGALPPDWARAQGSAGDSIQLSGRTVRCKNVRVLTSTRIPSEGIAAPGKVILNPSLLSAQPAAVRLFVFHHECGHHAVGASELQADCWAVRQGVRDGWLDANGLAQVCRSFEDAPVTPTHPSGRHRCRNLDQCFTKAVASVRPSKPPSTAAAVLATVPAASPPPRLVSGPTLVATGTLSYAGAAPCKEATAKGSAGNPARPGGCP